jgi:aryl-alcohol dehydrogenase-like predicted oxidoreductase
MNISRRRWIEGGMAAGFTLALRGPLANAAQASSLPLITVPIPSSGERLPVVGIGTNQYSVTAPEEIAARREVLQNLPQLGASVVDTAWGYGDSEQVIGSLVQDLGNRDRLFIATKTPNRGDIPPGAAAVDQALARLRTQRIDLLQVHNFHGIDALFPVLLNAKQAGKVRYVGVTTSTDEQYPQLVDALKTLPLDFIQVDYSIENRGAEDILKRARDKGVGVLINVPLGGRRASLLSKVTDKPLPDWAKDIDASSWPQVLLKYVISHPAVTAVIPGTTKLAHLEDNQRAARGRLPDAALRREMEAYWEKAI